MTIMIDREVAEKFVARAEWRGDCLEFTREVDKDGYGVFRQMKNGVRRKWKAHRVAYWLATGDDPEGRVVRHSCDNPPCINPEHLSAGTHGDNIMDKIERGRARGRWSYEKATHCGRGHEYVEGSHWVDKHGSRHCYECRHITRAARKMEAEPV